MNPKAQEHNEIYLLYACDVWKSRDSMRLISAGTDREVLYSAVLNELYENRMDYQGVSGTAAVARFRDAYRSGHINFGLLQYGHTDQVYNEAHFIPGQSEQRTMLYELLHMDDAVFERTFPVVSMGDEDNVEVRPLRDVLGEPEDELEQ